MPVTLQDPPANSSIAPTAKLKFRVSGEGSDFWLRLVYPDGQIEHAWDGTVFCPVFHYRSTRTDNGSSVYDFELGRLGTWKVAPLVEVSTGPAAVGPEGPQGPQGEPGQDGAQGPRGETGDTGASSYTGGDGILITGTTIEIDPSYVADEVHAGYMSSAQAATLDALGTVSQDADPETIAQRDEDGKLYAVHFVGAPATELRVLSQTDDLLVQNADGYGLAVSSTNTILHGGSAEFNIDNATNGIIVSTPGDLSITADNNTTFNIGGNFVGVVAADYSNTITGLATITGGTRLELIVTAGDVRVRPSSGITALYKGSNLAATITHNHTGVFSIVPVAGATSVLIQQAQHASAAGNGTTLAAQKGASGFVGGILHLEAGAGGTPGTNLGGAVYLEHGQTVSGTSAAFSWRANDVAYFQARKHISYAGGLLEGLVGGNLGLRGVGGVLCGSSDESCQTFWNQGDGGITHYSNYNEFNGQLSCAVNKITVAATININWNLSNTVWIGATVTTKITTNVTVAAPTSPREGNVVYLVRTLSNGVNTLAWNALFTFPSAAAPNRWLAGAPADNTINYHGFIWTGTAYECVYSV